MPFRRFFAALAAVAHVTAALRGMMPAATGARHALLLSVYVGSWVAALVKRKQPMRKAFLAPLQLELDDDEEERLVQAFNAALKETRRERRRLSLDDAAGVLVQTVSEVAIIFSNGREVLSRLAAFAALADLVRWAVQLCVIAKVSHQ